jgi:hypothetical protein
VNGVELPADLSDELHPNVRVVPMPHAMNNALHDFFDFAERRWFANTDCPACEYSPHPTPNRMEELRTMPYAAYLWTREWRLTRRAKLEDVGHQCRMCRQRKDLHVHHLTYDHVGHEWLDELVVLCRGCHQSVHDQRDEQRRRRRRR